jgi:hypothetical protein
MSTFDIDIDALHDELNNWIHREEEAVKVARLLYFALNQVRSTRINHPTFRTTYDLLAHIDKNYKSVVRQDCMEDWFNG